MATHRSGTSPNQWPVGALLRREGRSWPEMSPSARSLAVGGALLCTTVVAVSMAAEPDEPAAPPAVDPLPTPATAPEPVVEPPVGDDLAEPPTARADPHIVAAPPPLSPTGSGGPAAVVDPNPPRSSSRVPDVQRQPGRLVPEPPVGEADAGPVDGDAIVAEALDPPAGRHPEHDGDTDHRGDREPAAPVRSARDNAEKRTGKSARAKIVRDELERVKPKPNKSDRATAKPATNGAGTQDRKDDRRAADDPDAAERDTQDRNDDRGEDRNERTRTGRDRDDERAGQDEHDRGADNENDSADRAARDDDDSADRGGRDDDDSADRAARDDDELADRGGRRDDDSADRDDRDDGGRAVTDDDSADRDGCDDGDPGRGDRDEGDSADGDAEQHDESGSDGSDERDRDSSEPRHAAAR